MSDFGPTIDDLIKSGRKSSSDNTTGLEEETVSKFKDKILEINKAEKETSTKLKASSLGLPYINLYKFPISPEALALVPEEEAYNNKIVCFYRTHTEARFGTTMPESPEILEIINNVIETKHLTNATLYLISENSFSLATQQYSNLPKIKKIFKGVELSEESLKKFAENVIVIKDLQKKIANVNTSEIVSAIISLALQIDASDIHVEAEEQHVVIRYRVDGILNEAATLDKEKWNKITTRIKLLSNLKLNIQNKPQDGRFTIFLTGDKVDVRVSVVPTTFGESIVMRLLRSSKTGLRFEDLGIIGNSFKRLEEEIKKPNGMIITTGPTGSGKTTTLYSILSKLNSEATKIITLEDPVEYKLEGINQSQVDYSKGYDFSSGLRSLLRQDPDIVMVGEIRDLETADVSINAALTGHLVVSTLHTNSASAAIPRFISMGVKGFLLSPALNAIIGQRLVRKVCNNCKTEINPMPEVNKIITEQLGLIDKKILKEAGINTLENIKLYRGKGCSECHGIGYKGRVGIYEILLMNKEIEDLILSSQVSEYDIQSIAVKNGMITMVQDGLIKAILGTTTPEEALRVSKILT